MQKEHIVFLETSFRIVIKIQNLNVELIPTRTPFLSTRSSYLMFVIFDIFYTETDNRM